ncbi:MAG: hypothetical protein II661_10100 [Bacteroidales bacterium]|nr:hypothetical protein [Bacteroidales bacterium]
MSIEEMSNGFDVLVDSYRRFKDFDKRDEFDSIEFDEYAKSVHLTQAQQDVVVSLYNGKNAYGEAFENSEEQRRYLDPLVKTKEYDYSERLGSRIGVSETSIFFTLPTDLAFITLEEIKFNDETLGCASSSTGGVYPVTQDEYLRVRKNPFRGPTKYKVLRLDSGEGTVELVSKYTISKYLIRYLAKPEPIILENLTGGLSIEGESTAQGCQMNPLLHDAILRRAVQSALASKGIQVNNQ